MQCKMEIYVLVLWLANLIGLRNLKEPPNRDGCINEVDRVAETQINTRFST